LLFLRGERDGYDIGVGVGMVGVVVGDIGGGHDGGSNVRNINVRVTGLLKVG
jgi:hypothetical protein